ncbi:MAG: FixH family protein, partial [Gallionellaceae bacterium]|nr:FixH family protein [Gallionellaceae bacterium]
IKNPGAIVAGTPTAYEIFVKDKEGKPVSGIMEVQAYRAADASKDFITPFEEVAPGRYQGYINFTLKGYWELHIHIVRGEDRFGVDTKKFMVAAAS